MRYIIFVIDHPENLGNPEEMKMIDQFNDQLRNDGYWVLAAGIGNPRSAVLIDNRAGKGEVGNASLFDGHQNHDENYSGFWIIDVPSHEIALSLAKEGSRACNRKVELRPFLGNAQD